MSEIASFWREQPTGYRPNSISLTEPKEYRLLLLFTTKTQSPNICASFCKMHHHVGDKVCYDVQSYIYHRNIFKQMFKELFFSVISQLIMINYIILED